MTIMTNDKFDTEKSNYVHQGNDSNVLTQQNDLPQKSHEDVQQFTYFESTQPQEL